MWQTNMSRKRFVLMHWILCRYCSVVWSCHLRNLLLYTAGFWGSIEAPLLSLWSWGTPPLSRCWAGCYRQYGITRHSPPATCKRNGFGKGLGLFNRIENALVTKSTNREAVSLLDSLTTFYSCNEGTTFTAHIFTWSLFWRNPVLVWRDKNL